MGPLNMDKYDYRFKYGKAPKRSWFSLYCKEPLLCCVAGIVGFGVIYLVILGVMAISGAE